MIGPLAGYTLAEWWYGLPRVSLLSTLPSPVLCPLLWVDLRLCVPTCVCVCRCGHAFWVLPSHWMFCPLPLACSHEVPVLPLSVPIIRGDVEYHCCCCRFYSWLELRMCRYDHTNQLASCFACERSWSSLCYLARNRGIVVALGRGLRRRTARPLLPACMLRLLPRGCTIGGLPPPVLASRTPTASRNPSRSLRTVGARDSMTFPFGRSRAFWMNPATVTVAGVIGWFSPTCMRLRG